MKGAYRSMKQRTYIAIDLKSFYASVECKERELDPMTTNLVVADKSRTEKTICLAVSPSLKSYGIPGRARLFEVVQKVKEVNKRRICMAPGKKFAGASVDNEEIKLHPELELDYITAVPRMALYMKCSTEIYNIYLKYVAPEDIHVYSIDEIFADVTDYLHTYKMTAHELAMTMIRQVLRTTGITATAGIGTNLYLCKVAMDVVAKHIPADKDGVRIAELDEMGYRQKLWDHQPMADFWRFGRGIVARLSSIGVNTMGQLARLSVNNEELLYQMFGVNAELIIDHAWGWEPVTMDYIKAYKPETNSLGSGQVLQCPYTAEKGRVVVREMADALSLDLVDKHLVGDQVVLTVGYDRESLTNPAIRAQYHGEVTTDWYGRSVPKHAHGTISLGHPTSSSKQIIDAVSELYDRIVNPILLVRRLNITVNHVIPEAEAKRQQQNTPVQLDLFTDYEAEAEKQKQENEAAARERRLQEAALKIKKEFGKNALLRGLNYAEGATQKDRNNQIGGHKA